jgi:hypothetical protein
MHENLLVVFGSPADGMHSLALKLDSKCRKRSIAQGRDFLSRLSPPFNDWQKSGRRPEAPSVSVFCLSDPTALLDAPSMMRLPGSIAKLIVDNPTVSLIDLRKQRGITHYQMWMAQTMFRVHCKTGRGSSAYKASIC